MTPPNPPWSESARPVDCGVEGRDGLGGVAEKKNNNRKTGLDSEHRHSTNVSRIRGGNISCVEIVVGTTVADVVGNFYNAP